MSDKDVLVEAIKSLAGQDKGAKAGDLYNRLKWGPVRMRQAVRDALSDGTIALEYFDGESRLAPTMAEGAELIDMQGEDDRRRYVSGLRLITSEQAEQTERKPNEQTNKPTRKPTNNHGGARAGAGRKAGDPRFRRDLIAIRLPGWMIEWLNGQDNKGKMVELALKRYYALQEPQADRG